MKSSHKRKIPTIIRKVILQRLSFPCVCLCVSPVVMLAKISQGPTQLLQLFSAVQEPISMQHRYKSVNMLPPFAAVAMLLRNFTLQRMGVLCISLYTTYAQFFNQSGELCEIVTSSVSWRTKIHNLFF